MIRKPLIGYPTQSLPTLPYWYGTAQRHVPGERVCDCITAHPAVHPPSNPWIDDVNNDTTASGAHGDWCWQGIRPIESKKGVEIAAASAPRQVLASCSSSSPQCMIGGRVLNSPCLIRNRIVLKVLKPPISSCVVVAQGNSFADGFFAVSNAERFFDAFAGVCGFLLRGREDSRAASLTTSVTIQPHVVGRDLVVHTIVTESSNAVDTGGHVSEDIVSTIEMIRVWSWSELSVTSRDGDALLTTRVADSECVGYRPSWSRMPWIVPPLVATGLKSTTWWV